MSFYRFPEVKNKSALVSGTSRARVGKISAELQEVRNALNSIGDSGNVEHDRWEYGMELMDVIHAAETALRFDFSDFEVEQMRKDVEAKNRARGYYDEEDAQGGDS